MQSCFPVSKDIRLASAHYFMMKILNKRELQQSAINPLSQINFKDFMKHHKESTAKPLSF